MKFSVAAVLAFAVAFAAAQDPGSLAQLGFPKCAIDCVISGNKDAGCNTEDTKCHCAKPAKDKVTACLAKAKPCSSGDLDTLTKVGDTTCASATKTQPNKDATGTAKPNVAIIEKSAPGMLGLVALAAAIAL